MPKAKKKEVEKEEKDGEELEEGEEKTPKEGDGDFNPDALDGAFEDDDYYSEDFGGDEY